jgi:ribosomal-protein-alanine N-acetyltransferase
VAYFFHPSAWGQGYASEMIAACIGVADHVLQLPEMRAFAIRRTRDRGACWRRLASK